MFILFIGIPNHCPEITRWLFDELGFQTFHKDFEHQKKIAPNYRVSQPRPMCIKEDMNIKEV